MAVRRMLGGIIYPYLHIKEEKKKEIFEKVF
jgi:hypothetical protein